MKYLDKELSEYSKPELESIIASFWDAEIKREEASKHEKFSRTDGKAMEFPPPNPEYLKLKSAIETEINERWNNV